MEQSKKKILFIVIPACVIIFILGSIYFIFSANQKNNSINTNLIVNASIPMNLNSSAVLTSSLKQYDGKVLKISSDDGKMSGQAWIKYINESGKESLRVRYNIFLNDELNLNGTCGGNDKPNCGKIIAYEYDHKIFTLNKNQYMNGATVFPALCNKNQQIANPDVSFTSYYGATQCGVDSRYGAPTSVFVLNGKMNFQSYEDILQSYKISIIDSSKFWYSIPTPGSTDPNEKQYRLDQDKALANGLEVKSYAIKIE